MLKEERVDIKKNTIVELSKEIFEILLMDSTTNKNIIWNTEYYINYGKCYNIIDKITIEKIT